jgi:periplasmic divalent cation tolerance protein
VKPPAVTEFCVVTTTTDSQAHARALAAQIVQEGLGACVQLQAIESHYIWQGQAEQSSEWRLTIKTRSALYPELERFIRAHHHYDTPQVLCLPLLAGEPHYLEWLRQQTDRGASQA